MLASYKMNRLELLVSLIFVPGLAKLMAGPDNNISIRALIKKNYNWSPTPNRFSNSSSVRLSVRNCARLHVYRQIICAQYVCIVQYTQWRPRDRYAVQVLFIFSRCRAFLLSFKSELVTAFQSIT